jgi:hypothetical protein
MLSAWCVCLAAVAGSVACVPTVAATYRLDDTGTLPVDGTVLLRWRTIAPTRGRDDLLVGNVGVIVRLDLSPWVGGSGRIYLVLPEQGTVPTRVSWTTQGRLLPGEMRTGQRVLVHSGPILVPRLEETLLMRIEADGTRLEGVQRLDFHFEIDTD